MIYCLTGDLLHKTPDSAVISCGGVGYLVQIPVSVAGGLPAPGHEVTLYTVMNVTENDVSLYGFLTEAQRNCFTLLISVSGVGPKAALAVLSVLTPERVALAVSAGDHKAFRAASGVGTKLAQRITLELKDKFGRGLAVEGVEMEDVSMAVNTSAASAQAIEAMVSLGYSQSDAALAVSKIDTSLPVEEIIKLALRSMAGRR